MSDRNKNKKESLSEFIRYKQGKMSGEERNSFEKELQKDPFAEEAADGFDPIPANAVIDDLSILQKRIKSRIKNRKRFMYYSIAASVAVLMVISTLYIILNRDNTTQQQIAALTGTEKSVSKEEQALPVPDEDKKTDAKEAVQEKTKSEEAKKQVIVADKMQGTGAAVKKLDPIPQVSDPVAEIKVNDINASVAEMKVAPPAAARSKAVSAQLFSTSGKVISSEDNMPVPGAIVSIKGTNTSVITDTGGNFTLSLPDSARKTLVANFIGMESKEFSAKADSRTELKLDPDLTSLSEVVVVGYGAKKADYDEAEGPSGYAPPQPSGGKSAFNKYVEENIIRPDSLPEGQRVVVVLGILVHPDGSLGEIKIVRSPGKVFSAEAIRLIESGPKWNPAMNDGKVIEDEVKVRIVFK